MKILHITNEITKKNFSISSLILYLADVLRKNYNIESSILISKFDETLNQLHNDKIQLINFNSWVDVFFNFRKLMAYQKNFDLIHIHGIWAPIQLFSIILCNFIKIKAVIHPHGMLLEEAIRGSGYFKFCLKKLTLFFLKHITQNNIKFIAITDQEKTAIKNYFPNNSIKKIANPVPFEINKLKELNLNKTIVYFGRIHPHKNIDLLIDAFKKANLSSEWKLEIYGIKDDEKYLKFCEEKIKENKNIKILDPIFGLEKQEKMKSSWLNILVSKSEVISLSILESTIFELPSLINKKIEFSKDDSEVIKVDENIDNITNKIIEITRWPTEFRKKIGKRFKQILQNRNINSETINKFSIFYFDLYNSNKNEEHKFIPEKNELKKIFNFFIVSSSYVFNLMFASLIVVVLVMTGFYNIAGELGLVVSLWISITQIFSSNMRSIIISDNNVLKAKRTLIYRFFLSTFMFYIFYLVNEKSSIFVNTDIVYVISIFILCQWVNEMKLVQWEINHKYFYINLYLFINIIVVLAIIFTLILNEINLLPIILIGLAGYISLLFISDFNFREFNEVFINFKKVILDNISTIAFASSFSIIISSFLWRLMIFFIFDKSVAGIFFACFSVGSFPGTLINSIIGPTFVKYKIKVPKIIKFVFFIIFLILISNLIFLIISISQSPIINYTQKEFLMFTITISLIGSFFMSYSMYLRHKIIQTDMALRYNLFKTDIIYGSSITILIPFLYYAVGTFAVSFAFFIASIIAFMFYNSANLRLKLS